MWPEIAACENKISQLELDGVVYRIGARVRMLPRQGGDIFDLALRQQTGRIESIEQDLEGTFHFAIVVDLDPGHDLGLHRKIAHRFFFHADELELLPAQTILVACIGNVFHGDDGFGVEVANQLRAVALPDHVRVAEFGVRGFDLALALNDGYETVIFIDALQQTAPPGTVYLLAHEQDESLPTAAWNGHQLTPYHALALAQQFGKSLPRVYIIGCEPMQLDESMGLSLPVAQAIPSAIEMLQSLIDKLCNHQLQK